MRRTCRRADGLQAEDSAKAPVHFVHEGGGKLAHGGVEAGLVESDQGGDVDHGVPGQPAGDRGNEDVTGIAARPVFDVMTAASVVFSLLAL